MPNCADLLTKDAGIFGLALNDGKSDLDLQITFDADEAAESGADPMFAEGADPLFPDEDDGRGLPSSTFQLNLSRV